jgi:excinuclease ABC subunit A
LQPTPAPVISSTAVGHGLADAGLPPAAAHPGMPSNGKGAIAIRGARANNLRSVDVDFPKGALCVVTGVSGSGKSSLVGDVLEAEARRRFLETLSMYERQGVREGPEAPVESVSGLGVAVRIGSERGLYDRRATVGTASELTHHLAVLLSLAGQRDCPSCLTPMQRTGQAGPAQRWRCPACGQQAPVGEPRHFLPSNYAAACRTCHGVGTMQVPAPHKLIIHPELPLCAGAMYSPGFFPKGYLGKPFNGGYDQLQGMAAHYGFDPFSTPWQDMTPEAQQAFLFGDPGPFSITYRSRKGRTTTRAGGFPGFYGYIRDWDTGGTYTDTQPCPECSGSRLRAEFAAVRLGGQASAGLNRMPLADLSTLLDGLPDAAPEQGAGTGGTSLAAASLEIARRRAHFLTRVGLGYLHLDRPSGTLSAGEAQRIRLAGLLGSQLTALTVLLDEPSRGLHPSEVETLVEALRELCAAGNTVVVVEHEPLFMRAADFLVDMGPGAGADGGQVVASGAPAQVLSAGTLTARWLRGERSSTAVHRQRKQPGKTWLEIEGASGNNLRGERVRLPLGVLCGVCGVSGSGKSTLVIDTLARVLAPHKQTGSVAREPIDPLPYRAIHGAPKRVVLVDQARAGLHSPAAFLGLSDPLIELFAQTEAARALGLGAPQLARRCSACHGSGVQRLDMGFLPPVVSPCETCRGTGFLPEAWEVRLRGRALPEWFGLTLAEIETLLRAEQAAGREVPPALLPGLSAAQAVGLGYLVFNQPGFSLSGGEAQRLKIAVELMLVSTGKQPARRKNGEPALFILDEPTVGQHLEDVERLAGVLQRLVDAGHSVLVIEHHPHLLAACDWLVELGPGGGPQGGAVVAAGPPEALARGATPIAPYLRAVMEDRL